MQVGGYLQDGCRVICDLCTCWSDVSNQTTLERRGEVGGGRSRDLPAVRPVIQERAHAAAASSSTVSDRQSPFSCNPVGQFSQSKQSPKGLQQKREHIGQVISSHLIFMGVIMVMLFPGRSMVDGGETRRDRKEKKQAKNNDFSPPLHEIQGSKVVSLLILAWT